ncbi:MAG: glycosyltransferase family 4 protein [Bacteroidota bacterium]
MRLFYLSNSLIPSKEANSIQVMKMCRAFSRYCDSVVLFARHSGEEVDDIYTYYGVDPSFEVRRIQTPKVRKVRRFLQAMKITGQLRKEKPGFYLFGRDFYVLGIMAWLGLVKAPMSLEIHQPPTGKFQHWLQKKIFQSRHFEQLVVISEALAKEYARLFGDLVRNKTVVAHDGADVSQLPERLLSNPTYEQKSSAFKVGYIGSLYPGKGMGMISKLAPLMPDCEFHVVGGKPHELDFWQKDTNSENLILHGFVSPDRIYEVMEEFDVVLAPYQPKVLVGDSKVDIASWMSPLKLFEYMAGGKPIICSDLPVLMEVLHHDENGLMAKSTDPESWVAQIRRVKDSEKLRERLGRKAQQDFFAHYTWEKRVEHLLGITSDSSTTAQPLVSDSPSTNGQALSLSPDSDPHLNG